MTMFFRHAWLRALLWAALLYGAWILAGWIHSTSIVVVWAAVFMLAGGYWETAIRRNADRVNEIDS